MSLRYQNDIVFIAYIIILYKITQDSKVEFLRSYYYTFHVESKKKQVAMM